MDRLKGPLAPFGSVKYAVPRIGEHGTLSCFFGSHWWTLVRSVQTKVVLSVMCGACQKHLKVHDHLATTETVCNMEAKLLL